jgi:hypothetical protein
VPSAWGAPKTEPSENPLAPYVLGQVPKGFTLQTQGPLNTAAISLFGPNPAAEQRVFEQLGAAGHFLTYERSWASPGGMNSIRDIIVSLPSVSSARALALGEEQSLEATKSFESSVPMIPGALHEILLTSVPSNGVLQVIVFEVERYVGTMTLFSAATPNNHAEFTSSQGALLATSQYHLLFSGPGVGPVVIRHPSSSSDLGVILVIIGTGALVGLAVLFLRRRRGVVVPIVEAELDPSMLGVGSVLPSASSGSSSH